MKRRHVVSLVIAAASLMVVGITLAAQDRYALKSPSGIAFSEFKGYGAWQAITVSQPDDSGGCGSSPPPGCMKLILGNPAMIKAYNDGIPANGKAVPDGAAFAKIEWHKARPSRTAYGVTVPGTYAEVGFMLKDSKRFPNTNGWGYATFRYDAAAGAFTPYGDGPQFVYACHACHTIVRDNDYVFTEYAPR